MALPTLTKTWIIDPCNRIPFVSVLGTMQAYLFEFKAFLKLNGFTVKGSASAGVGAMDAVDRWTSAATVTPRATIAGASQAWIVLTSTGSAIDICFAFQGSGDDFCRIAFSPGGLYVAAGTPNQQPTASDEVVDHLATVSMINSTASGDRLWSGWVSSDAKMVRSAIARGGSWISSFGGTTGHGIWFIEQFSSVAVAPASGTPAANPTWIGCFQGANTIPNGTQIGRSRLIIASTAFTAAIHFGMEYQFGNPSTFGTEKPQLQGALGYPIFPVSLFADTGGARGKLGNVIDAWTGRTTLDTSGDTYGTLQFITMNGYIGTAAGGGVWPWDGVTVPVMT